MAERIGVWDGGYIHEDKRGRRVYVIRQQINGKRYEISTRTFTERAALEQWKRFQSDPEGYDPRGEVRQQPLYLDEKLAEAFLGHSRRDKENTAKWVREQKVVLAWWAKELHGVDLRGASLRDDILPALERAPGRYRSVTVIKGLYSWLRRVRRDITLDDDPTAAGALVVPAPKRERTRAPKAVPREHVELAREHLVSTYRDALDLQAETGWHVTEVQRFAADGDCEPASSAQKEQGIAGVLVVRHKSGDQHRTAVSARTLAAAQRLRDRGGLSIAWYMRAIKSACKAAGLKKPFGPGQMRHSVATWAVEAGADIATVSTFLGHRSPLTTKRFYATHATPRNPMLSLPRPRKRPSRR
ncbi:MAG TPA: tyrosine-type recombinase/integrase [Myxococcales bacterium]|jgi:integrase